MWLPQWFDDAVWTKSWLLRSPIPWFVNLWNVIDAKIVKESQWLPKPSVQSHQPAADHQRSSYYPSTCFIILDARLQWSGRHWTPAITIFRFLAARLQHSANIEFQRLPVSIQLFRAQSSGHWAIPFDSAHSLATAFVAQAKKRHGRLTHNFDKPSASQPSRLAYHGGFRSLFVFVCCCWPPSLWPRDVQDAMPLHHATVNDCDWLSCIHPSMICDGCDQCTLLHSSFPPEANVAFQCFVLFNFTSIRTRG